MSVSGVAPKRHLSREGGHSGDLGSGSGGFFLTEFLVCEFWGREAKRVARPIVPTVDLAFSKKRQVSVLPHSHLQHGKSLHRTQHAIMHREMSEEDALEQPPCCWHRGVNPFCPRGHEGSPAERIDWVHARFCVIFLKSLNSIHSVCLSKK